MTTTWQISYFRALFHKLDETAHPDTLRHTLKMDIWTSQTQRDCTKLYKLTHLHTADWANCKSTLIPQIRSCTSVHLDAANWTKKNSIANCETANLDTTKCKTAIANCTKPQISTTNWTKCTTNHTRLHIPTLQIVRIANLDTANAHLDTASCAKLQILTPQNPKLHILTEEIDGCKKNTHQINDMFNSDVTFCTLAKPNPWETLTKCFWPNTRTKLS